MQDILKGHIQQGSDVIDYAAVDLLTENAKDLIKQKSCGEVLNDFREKTWTEHRIQKQCILSEWAATRLVVFLWRSRIFIPDYIYIEVKKHTDDRFRDTTRFYKTGKHVSPFSERESLQVFN